MNIADLRCDYTTQGLSEADAPPEPFTLFESWFEEVLAAGLADPNAMTLATATTNGRPSARIVLLKGFDSQGFVFFTNYESRKGEELAANPYAALVFWWGPLERQVRIEGHVERVDHAASDAYHDSRPRDSQLGAWASPQSRMLDGRAVLEARLADAEARFAGAPVPRPPHWGGFRLIPDVVEFWQGRTSRLHDRLRYLRIDEGWTLGRLAP